MTTNKKAGKIQQNELRAEYRALLENEAWRNDPKMVDHCMKQISRIVELDAGLIEIEKPRIKTRFCFGYHLSRFDNDDYDRATSAARAAQKSVDFFKRENLREMVEYIEALKDDSLTWYSRKHYTTNPPGSRCRALACKRRWEEPRPYEKDDFIPLTAEDLENVVAGYEIALADFEKRLNTYLKRYGLSKVDTWTYWADE